MKPRKTSFFSGRRPAAEEAAAGIVPLIAKAEKAAHSVTQGGHRRRKAGTGEKFWQFRDYAAPDRPQDIDWRQSARGDRLFVREKEWHTAQNVFLWCQHNEAMAYRSHDSLPEKHESASVLCLALALLLTHAGERVAALESDIAPGRSDSALQKLDAHFAAHKTDDVPGISGENAPSHATFILAGDFLAPAEQIEESFARLAASGANATVLQILDPAELAFPFEGRLILERSGSGERHAVDNAAAIRAAYRERIERHLDFIKNCCRKHGWNWILHTTDEDLRDTLLGAWEMISPLIPHGGGKS